MEHIYFSSETIKNFGDGVILLDSDFKILVANPLVEKILETPEKELIGRPINDYWGEHEILYYLEEAKANAEITSGIEISLISESQKIETTVSLSISPIFTRKGTFKGALLLMQDITEMTNLKIQLIRQNQLFTVGTLASWVAHEIRNPLTSLNVHLELLREEVADMPQEYAQSLTGIVQTLRSEITRLDYNLDSFLNFSGLPPLSKEPCDLNEIVETTVEFMDAEAQLEDVYLEFYPAEKLPLVQLDINQIHLVLVNLIRNAIQSIENEGEINVYTDIVPDYVRIRVVDTGCGIADDKLSSIFDFMYTTKQNSSGLGLPIVKKIVSAHGGKINVESKVGVGTEFILELPL